MNYCGECDIAFEERDCPLCEAKTNIANLEAEIQDLNQQLDDLNKESAKDENL